VNAVLSAIGLALDFVGAVFIVFGLFRPARATFPGYAYAPDDAARDASFGSAGGSLLAFGFVFQSLTYFGLSPKCSGWVNFIASVIALVAGFAWALIVYEVTHRHVFDRRRAEGQRRWPDITPYPLDRRRGLWFWRPKDE
jgi:dipeptide/tripeptide permease